MAIIIGRQEELSELKSLQTKDSSTFVAVYGRRRVGKTFLIRQAYEGQFTFHMTGMANGQIEEFDVVSSVELKFKNRRTICNAMVLPSDSEVLLGVIPLEDMDVLVDPLRQELIVNPDYPYFAQMKLKGIPRHYL